jgi:hypothetical protein
VSLDVLVGYDKRGLDRTDGLQDDWLGGADGFRRFHRAAVASTYL